MIVKANQILNPILIYF